MAKLSLPRFMTPRQRAAGPYWIWQPPSRLKAQGFKAVALNDRDGPSPLPIAMAQAQWMNAIFDCLRKQRPEAALAILQAWGEGRDGAGLGLSSSATACTVIAYQWPGLDAKSIAAPPAPRQSIAELARLYQQSPDFLKNRKTTRQGYARILADFSRGAFGRQPVPGFGRKKLRATYETLVRAHGAASATARMRVLSVILSYAVEMEWIEINPLLRFRYLPLPGRIRVPRESEIAELLAAAQALDRPDGALLILAAALTGQRRGDLVESLTLKGLATQMQAFDQQKRGAHVRLVMLDELAAAARVAVAAMEARWGNLDQRFATLKLKGVTARRRPFWFRHLTETPLVWNIARGLPLDRHSATRLFGLLRAKAGVADLRLSDFRDYFVTECFRAGMTDAQAASLSGHSASSIAMLRKHYVSREDPEINATAFAKLTARRAHLKGQV